MNSRSDDGRRRAERFGRLAETVCAWHLRLRGFRILAVRLRTPVGEVDIVAKRGPLFVFVEVKARPDLASAIAAIGPAQRRRLARAADAFLASHAQGVEYGVRFDVMLVRPWRLPVHIIDAWRPEMMA